MKKLFITGIFISGFVMNAFSQTIYFNFIDGTHSQYSISDVRSITFTGDVMNLNKTNGTTVSWNVSTIGNYNYDGVSGILERVNSNIHEFSLFPNPSNGALTINYTLEQNEKVRMEMIDGQGKVIDVLINQKQEAGTHTIRWNKNDNSKKEIPAGIYFIVNRIGNAEYNEKIIITP